MSVQPAVVDLPQPGRPSLRSASRRIVWAAWRAVRWPLIFAAALLLLGGGAWTAAMEQSARISLAVSSYNFDLLDWEIAAIGAKVRALVEHPAKAIPAEKTSAFVEGYLERASEIRRLEREINSILSQNGDEWNEEARKLQAQIDTLRAEQRATRATAEQIIESQTAQVLADAGLDVAGVAFPPVFFAFTEPPKKLIVSPRERILTLHGQMLDAEISLESIELAEERIEAETGTSAYVTNIGGLGAYPSMVVERAPLPWVLTTVAHEWTHNYLTLFPLGLLYNASPDLTTINETVADIVGDEIGQRVLELYYPHLVPPPAPLTPPPSAIGGEEPPAFDFNAEMRHTRETVDKLLAFGRVEDAERYMELRRQLFVENGFPLRKLNQAYFAFHGSYGGSPGSTSPLYPKLTRLRELTPDVAAFLREVRGVTSVEELDARLAKWESHE